jgi:6-phosphofructokinase
VTCGGLCPGLNTVIRELVCGLYHMYGVKKVLGISVSESSNKLILSEDIRMNVKKILTTLLSCQFISPLLLI